ncbi:right-handed parallel beta-helix repeat-containing protein [Kiloniella sp.]|uniref:right-handed parallel beta-helix repeat-containing protein n=1 Tax=Kiloniella sp. TaxID=1938587 RepID=UPI003B011EFC
MNKKRKFRTLLSLTVLPIAVLGVFNFEALRSFCTLNYLGLIKVPFLVGELSEPPDYFTEKNAQIFEEEAGVLRIKKGVWNIDHPIILDGSLTISQGTTLNFAPNSYLIVRGALTALGSKLNPIKIQGQTGRLWKGIYVYGAESPSQLENVVISDTNALVDGYLKLSGGVTFYQSNVAIENTVFYGSQAEDGLNIISSEFSLKNTRFENMRSDALDSDFSQGAIKDSNFSSIGGDAIDFSGSKSWVEYPHIYNVRDKAISAGENSTVNVLGGYVKSVGVAAASKDGSVVDIVDTRIEDVSLFGLMTYVKKPSYSYPTLNAYNLSWGEDVSKQASNNWIRQAGTVLTIDGVNVPEKNLNVKALYKGKVMSK